MPKISNRDIFEVMETKVFGQNRDYIAHISGNRIQTIAEHCRNVAALASDNLKMFGLGKTGYLAGLLHDMGKYSDEFQEYIRITDPDEKKAKKGTVIHSFAAVRRILCDFHHKREYENIEDVTAELVAFACGAHHGLFDILDPSGPSSEKDGSDGFGHRMNRQPEKDDVSACRFFGFCASETEIRELFEDACRETKTALGSVAENIRRSAGMHKSETYDFHIGLLARLILSAVIDADRSDAAAFEGIDMPVCTRPDWNKAEKELESHLQTMQSDTPIGLARREFSDICRNSSDRKPGIYRLDMPTGAGKTLSGIRFAVSHAKKCGMDRIYYVAPLLSIIDQNEDVIRQAVPSVPVLAHHSDTTPKDKTDSEDAGMQDLAKENWNNPVIVTTLARVLEAMFGSSAADIRRFRALANSIIIFDEVQSVPMKTIHMFNMAVNFLAGFCHSTVILASATQPEFGITDYPMDIEGSIVPLSTYRKHEKTFKRTRMIYAGSGTIDDASGFVNGLVEKHDSILVVCNTKKEVAKIYEGLPESCTKFHLSASMCPAHRKDVIARIRKALSLEEKIVCVSSQVIEAGVDISFGCVVRTAAGVDNAVQAGGRGNRHGEMSGLAPVYIFVINNEQLGELEEIRDSKSAFLMLCAHLKENLGIAMDSPEAIAKYYEYRYRNRFTQMSYPMEGTTMVDLLSTNRRTARKFGDSRWFLRQSFACAARQFKVYDDEQIPVIVPYGDGARIIGKLSGNPDIRNLLSEFREARQYTVSVYEGTFCKLEQAGAIRQIEVKNVVVYCLAEGFYDEEKGVTTCGTTTEL